MKQEILTFYKASRASLVSTQPHIEYGSSFTKRTMGEEWSWLLTCVNAKVKYA